MMAPMLWPSQAETTTIMSVRRLTVLERAVSQNGGLHAWTARDVERGSRRTAVPNMFRTRRPIAVICYTALAVSGSGEVRDSESQSGCSGDSSDYRG
jgi:hypothetical protein